MWSLFFLRLIKFLPFNGFILCFICIQCSIVQSSICLPGCKCSMNPNNNVDNTELNKKIAVVCCLANRTRLLKSISSDDYPTDIKHCAVDLTTPTTTTTKAVHNVIVWPDHTLCLPLWYQLKIQLTENSWPSLLLSSHTKLHIQTKCMLNLERLAIVGQPNLYDGFIQLESNQFRKYFFSTTTPSSSSGFNDVVAVVTLKLHRFTIEQTSLRLISQGFFDEIGAVNLHDLEIRRNINLTEHGLGVGWLANLKHLQTLDLSLNHLYRINLASWGLPKHYTSLNNLDLSGNRLVHLNDQTFQRLPNLIYLNLANNYLTTLSSNVFYGLKYLKILNLQGNQLKMHSLILTVPNFNMILPNLKQLILSRNPLAIVPSLKLSSSPNSTTTSPTTTMTWWFTNSCPKLMTTLYLENIEPLNDYYYLNKQTNLNQTTTSLYQLPTFTWNYCHSLTDIYLTHNEHWLKCIDYQWLHNHHRFRIHPSTLELCPMHKLHPWNNNNTNSSGSSNTSSSPSSLQHDTAATATTTQVRTTSISIHAAYWPISSTANDGVHAVNNMYPSHHQNINNHNNNTLNYSVNSWIILCIIVFLICIVFFTILLAIYYCIQYLNKRFNRKQIAYTTATTTTTDIINNGGLNALHHCDQLQPIHVTPDLMNHTMKSSIPLDNSSRMLTPYSFHCMDLTKSNQLFHYTTTTTDLRPMCNSCCYHVKRHASTQPVSPADSGLEDNSTPLTTIHQHQQQQQTPRHIFPSLDRRSARSSRRSSSRHHQRSRRPLLIDAGLTRCPSTSVSSSLLLLQHSPNHHPPYPLTEISYSGGGIGFAGGWPIPSMHFASHRVNAATSTEDVSIGPASTSVDTGEDACSSGTPSDKLLPIAMNFCEESIQQPNSTTTGTTTTTTATTATTTTTTDDDDNRNSNDTSNNNNNNNDNNS